MGIWREFINFFEREWQTGSQVEDYRIHSMLGKGSYGTAYLVKHNDTEQMAVLKRLRPYKRMIDPGGKLIRREAEILERLDYPYFPKLYGIGMKDKVPYLIMEYFEGDTFDKLIFQEGKRLDEQESLLVLKEIIQIVERLHAEGIVHRDLRIPNIIQDGDVYKIIDFGLAAEIDGKPSSPKKHRDYMREKSIRADFYALGHFLLFLLYSSYECEGARESSWEEELALASQTISLLRRLLQIDEPFEDSRTLSQYLERAITKKT
ncbi:serine/threonine protein kinase [Bacillus sp. AK031]